tara:strand:- start:341 stop:616 length:276 start_codon:yes stop_codon:yes gene_type:complete
MKSPALAPTEYDQRYQTELNTIISELDDNMMKLDKVNFLNSRTDSSGNIDQTGAIVLQSPDGTFYKLSVANGGGISGTAVTTDQTSNPYVT